MSLNNKITSLFIVLSILINAFTLTSCSENKKLDKETLNELLSDYTISEIIEVLSENHELDEIFAELKWKESDETEKSLEQLEQEYFDALKVGDSKAQELAIYKISRLLIFARIDEMSNIKANDIQKSYNIETVIENKPDSKQYVETNGHKFYFSGDDKPFTKLVINSENTRLRASGWDRPNSATTVYSGLKRDILATYNAKHQKFSKFDHNVNSRIDEQKVALIKSIKNRTK